VARFDGQTVLVTGASRGIGLATAQRFAALGASVGLVARDESALRTAAAALGVPTHVVACDLADPAACARAVDEVAGALGPVDVLISCAGPLFRDFVEDVKPAEFEQSWRAHVGGALWLTQRVLPGMRERRRGAIVLVSSELGLLGAPSYASYCASKWALVGLGETLLHELAGSGVRVCTVCPGDVRTGQLERERQWGPTAGKEGSAQSPERIAESIASLAAGGGGLVVLDRLSMRLQLSPLIGLRRLTRALSHGEFKPILRARGG
jgi:NAD(P)-dependent dehydrogenase (short-subunit alcohol dehydrogenase family)